MIVTITSILSPANTPLQQCFRDSMHTSYRSKAAIIVPAPALRWASWLFRGDISLVTL